MHENDSTKAEWVQEALRRYESPLIRYAAQFTGDVDRARDVVQDTFVKLCAADREQVEACLPQWLFTVCRNRALDVQRKECRMIHLDETTMEMCESRDVTPSAAVEQRDSASEVLRLLATLPANQQEVVRLKFQNELSYREISRITNLTVTNVGFLLHTALKTIRKRIGSETRPASNV